MSRVIKIFLAVIAAYFCVGLGSASATWVPTGKEDAETTLWFSLAKLTPAACARLKVIGCLCCAKADRVKTTFRVEKRRVDGTDKWEDVWYYEVENKWLEIPNDIIHYEDDPLMPPQLKLEGVLFIYNGNLSCFWPPQRNGGQLLIPKRSHLPD